MTQNDLAELRRLWEAATKGEWRCFRYSVASASLMVGDIVCQPPDDDCEQSLEKWPHNAAFIAAAHNALPALLDELETARAELEALKVPLAIYERHTKLIGAAEELERLARLDWFVFKNVTAEATADMILRRAAQLRQEAEGEEDAKND